MESLVITYIAILSLNLLVNPLVLGAPTSHHYNNNKSTTNQLVIECLIFQIQNSSSDHSQSNLQVIYTPENQYYSSIFHSSEQNLRPGLTSKYRPLVIITPLTESEIRAAIYCSKKNGVLMKVRGGGHDYEGLSYTSDTEPFVLVDMRNLRSISVDTKDKSCWVEAGATLGELYYAIAEKSGTLAFPAGACPTVGVGGHLSGGGYGMISRKHGLAIDNIIDAKVMGVDGRVLDRESMGEDLFWAIRGGGGTSFGIILAFKLRLNTVPEMVTVFNVTTSLEQNVTQLLHKWQYVSDKTDENLVIRPYMTSVRSHGVRRIQASFISLYLGRAKDVVLLMQEEFPELGLAEQDCIEMPWIESVLYFASLYNQPREVLLQRTHTEMYLKGKSDYVTRPIPEYGLTGIWDFLHEEDESVGGVQFSPYGGALSTFSESETPFPHRSGTKYMIHYDTYWSKEDHTHDPEWHVNWIRRLYGYMAPFVSNSPRGAYLNYRDLDIGMTTTSDDKLGGMRSSYQQASIWGLKYFKKNNFNRLVRVKTRVDPNNFFRNEQSIPPLSSGANHLMNVDHDDIDQLQTN